MVSRGSFPKVGALRLPTLQYAPVGAFFYGEPWHSVGRVSLRTRRGSFPKVGALRLPTLQYVPVGAFF